MWWAQTRFKFVRYFFLSARVTTNFFFSGCVTWNAVKGRSNNQQGFFAIFFLAWLRCERDLKTRFTPTRLPFLTSTFLSTSNSFYPFFFLNPDSTSCSTCLQLSLSLCQWLPFGGRLGGGGRWWLMIPHRSYDPTQDLWFHTGPMISHRFQPLKFEPPNQPTSGSEPLKISAILANVSLKMSHSCSSFSLWIPQFSQLLTENHEKSALSYFSSKISVFFYKNQQTSLSSLLIFSFFP